MSTENILETDTSIHVLLVDDQAIIAEGIRRMLESEQDIHLHYCAEPTAAIDQALEVNASVILQDLVMPDIDGMTLVRFYKANTNTKDIPIIVLSSKEDPAIKSEAFSYGASDYLVKLPDKIELIARIRSHAKNYIMQLERDAAFFALREMKKQLERSNLKLKKLSMLDGLTGIPNRRHFDTSLAEEFERAKDIGTPLSLILLDIDYFKLFNDQYGHQGGDDCLQQVAHAISNSCTKDADLTARYGGEEFVIVLPDTNIQNAKLVAERIRTNIEKLKIEHSASDVADVVTCSLGVSGLIPGSELTAKELVEYADIALYQSKNEGRNLVSIDPKLL